MVEWRSPGGNLIQFEDSGEAAVNSTSITLSPLIPGTNYLIKVSAITPRGRGEQISTTGAVLNSASQGIDLHPGLLCVVKIYYVMSSLCR